VKNCHVENGKNFGGDIFDANPSKISFAATEYTSIKIQEFRSCSTGISRRVQ
jgi:hypothetical protein